MHIKYIILIIIIIFLTKLWKIKKKSPFLLRQLFKTQLKYWLPVTWLYIVEYRQRGRFAGFSIYVSNTGDIEGSTLCYKDGPQLPPLNFTTTCTEHGRYVIFYNERQNEVVYPDGYQLSTMFTELCEVIVKGILFVLYHLSFSLRLLFKIKMETIVIFVSY